MKSYSIELEVRDYECDIQGIVNNSVYLNYLEHARHKHLIEAGEDFAALAKAGVNLVVTRAEVDYKRPLHSGETFLVSSSLERQGRIRFRFLQRIMREDTLILSAIIVGTAIDDNGRPNAAGLDKTLKLFGL